MIKKVCSKCGSEDIVADAWARWSPEKDMFVLDTVFDYTFCNKCEDETHDEDVDINEEEEQL
jgi:hypothetical protein